MKLSLIAAVAASAAFVSASPLRVIVVSTNVQPAERGPIANVRYGFAVPSAPGPLQTVESTPAPVAQVQPHRMPCGSRFRQKAIEISNSFRKAFGFPLIEMSEVHTVSPTDAGLVQIMPFKGAPTFDGPSPIANGRGWNRIPERIHVNTGSVEHYGPPGDRGHHRRPHNHFHPHHMHGRSRDFLGRVQFAIMSLGPWEGRAVAFVLGCGIGVLIRMLYVLALVAYRSIRGTSSEYEYTEVIVFDEEAEPAQARTPASAPPAYVYPVDEKIDYDAKAVTVTAAEPTTTDTTSN
ncbi:hypothetical protein FA15DRAFT_629074 [Coprinopsis marcescibilis]|uniref:Uncharacterized protein n=1 Tax=Coprinopsis marcescibilis TaxID=230819 RepID=A0A5C3KB35_COPMA|nr:hypothetical protein FA15DRAFT_629074 [Coprinopsis marcescibilis]